MSYGTKDDKKKLLEGLNHIYKTFGHNYVMARFKAVGMLTEYVGDVEIWKACNRIMMLDKDFHNVDKGETLTTY